MLNHGEFFFAIAIPALLFRSEMVVNLLDVEPLNLLYFFAVI